VLLLCNQLQRLRHNLFIICQPLHSPVIDGAHACLPSHSPCTHSKIRVLAPVLTAAFDHVMTLGCPAGVMLSKHSMSAKLSTLYNTIIRPVLEYASIIWNPWLRKDISALDSVQRKCEKLCTEKISFEPLSKRRHRFDLIETHKFVSNKYKMDPQSLFSLPHRTLRGHKDNIFKPSARTDIQKQFFSHRVVDSWNLLYSKIIEADTSGED